MSSRSDLHKGCCPSLTKPMESGDGLLVRLHMPSGFIDATIARAVAGLSAKYGNSEIDLTSRGNLQIRGVTPENYEPLFNDLTKLGITDEERPPRQDVPDKLPELGYISGALALGLLFGRISAASLKWLADKSADGKINLSTQHTMYLNNIPADKAASLLVEAENFGFITKSDDARRAIEACPGAPACKSASTPTRALALDIAKALPNLATEGKTIHVSGCIKGCACPREVSRVISGRFGAYAIAMDAKAEDAPLLTMLSHESVIRVLTEWENP